jgi:hypothetical protein
MMVQAAPLLHMHRFGFTDSNATLRDAASRRGIFIGAAGPLMTHTHTHRSLYISLSLAQ